MRLHFRIDSPLSAPHITIRVFIDGASAGLLTMTADEFASFQNLVAAGCALRDHKFEITRNTWTPRLVEPTITDD